MLFMSKFSRNGDFRAIRPQISHFRTKILDKKIVFWHLPFFLADLSRPRPPFSFSRPTFVKVKLLSWLLFVRPSRMYVAKRCKIGPRLLLIIDRKSHIGFQMKWKSSTVGDLKGHWNYYGRQLMSFLFFFGGVIAPVCFVPVTTPVNIEKVLPGQCCSFQEVWKLSCNGTNSARYVWDCALSNARLAIA